MMMLNLMTGWRFHFLFTFENIFGMIWVQKWGPRNGTFGNHDQPIDPEDSEVPYSRTPTSGWWFGT